MIPNFILEMVIFVIHNWVLIYTIFSYPPFIHCFNKIFVSNNVLFFTNKSSFILKKKNGYAKVSYQLLSIRFP